MQTVCYTPKYKSKCVARVGPFYFKVVGRYEREREKIVNFKNITIYWYYPSAGTIAEQFSFNFKLQAFFFSLIEKHCILFLTFIQIPSRFPFPNLSLFKEDRLLHYHSNPFLLAEAQYWDRYRSSYNCFLQSLALRFVGREAGCSAGISSKVTLLCFTWYFFISAVILSTLPRWQNKFNTCSIDVTCKTMQTFHKNWEGMLT